MSKLIGNAIVGQSGGPTAAINATHAGVIRGSFENTEYINTLYGMRNGVEGLLKEDLVNLSEFFSDAEKIDILEQFSLMLKKLTFLNKHLRRLLARVAKNCPRLMRAEKHTKSSLRFSKNII